MPALRLASALLCILVAADPSGIPHLADASIDGRVRAVALFLALFSGLLFGLVSTFQQHSSGILSSAARVAPRASTTLKHTLVIAQIVLSIALLTSAGLLVRSL